LGRTRNNPDCVSDGTCDRNRDTVNTFNAVKPFV
jgi:hypothetical protein